MKNEPLISVIIPVYNVELYIRDCLASVINQTYKNLEIIVVNDATPDRSMAIVEEFAKTDTRIKIINHEKNTGIGVVRNDALMQATGEFVAFVDSDDTIDRSYYEKLIKRQFETGSDIVRGSFITNTGFGKVFRYNITVSKMEHKWALSGLLMIGLYRRKLIVDNGILFPEIGLGEDAVFDFKTAFYANHLSTCKDAIYFYEKLKSDSYTHASVEEIKRVHEYVWKAYIEFLNQHSWPKKYNCLEDLFKDNLDMLYDTCPNRQIPSLPEKKKLKLFGFVPLYSIRMKRKSKWILLFNFIPFIKIK